MRVLKDWMNTSLVDVVDTLENEILSNYHVDMEGGLGIAGRLEIFEVLDAFLSVLFPGSYSKEKVSQDRLNFFIHDSLRHASFKLHSHVKEALRYRCMLEHCDKCECECDLKADEAVIKLLEEMPEIRRTLIEDINAAYSGDPAAISRDEVVLAYPCLDAIATHRIAHALYKLDVPIIPRIMSERSHSRTGIDIHPGATLGAGLFIDHGTGVVIGETCRIGKNVKIYQGVTLGALSPFDKQGRPRTGEKRHPDIEDDVIIYANATILGGKTVIGKGSIIGGNTWITKSIPEGTVVYNTTA